jgi:putative membrane-bound dehydrogenase-like protein
MNCNHLLHRALCISITFLFLIGSESRSQEATDSSLTSRKAIYDTQSLDLPRLSPEETAATAKLPLGFHMQVVAKDPDVQQPIGMCWDSRGRMWVAENYTYAEKERNFDVELHDRIIILEDSDHNGTFDKRQVFWSEGKKLTSIEIGFGGVWAMAPPNLLFIPDQDHDDIPDGPAQVILDGFEDESIRHNLANGLKWGPDGWLYGRHGIQAVSKVGVPGSSEIERTDLSCGIWRWHPTRMKLDVVTTGTTNPWGHDWDQNGQLFFINTVIGHLWHAIPGSHLQRMYGDDADSQTYELMSQVADHLHFDSGKENWSDIRKAGASPATDQAGGGHAHSGMMIYQAEQWPVEYRNKLFTLNYHGRRINVERLDRQGAGFVGRHEPDMVFLPDPWFRGIELASGPDGSVYVLDWSDIGECHDNDGVHRHSGVIYRIFYGDQSTAIARKDLRTQTDLELSNQISSSNSWLARQSRLILAERCRNETLSVDIIRDLIKQAKSDPEPQKRLTSLWTLANCGKDNSSFVLPLLKDSDEHVRIQAIHLLTDPSRNSSDVTDDFEKLLTSETSDLVFLHVASAMQRTQGKRWWNVMAQLCARSSLADDRDYPLMVWYALKQGLNASPNEGIGLLEKLESNDGQIPFRKLLRFAVRLYSSQLPREEVSLDQLLLLASKKSPAFQTEVVAGMHQGLLGRHRVKSPKIWKNFSDAVSKHPNAETRDAILGLGALFGDGLAAESLSKIVADNKASSEARISALQAMTENRVAGIKEIAYKFVRDRSLGAQAIKSILELGNAEDAQKVLSMFFEKSNPSAAIKEVVLAGLVRRRDYLPVLFELVESGKVPAEVIDAASLRQMQMLGDEAINSKLSKLWPQTNLIGKERLTQIHALEAKLTIEALSEANLGRGRTTWNKLCSSCHKLYGQGGLIGPELTGAQRTNLRYWTENVLDPSGAVAANYRVTLFLIDDGSLVTGVIASEDDATVTVQTVKEKVVIEKDTIEQRKTSTQSLMPEGLLDALDDSQRRDLVAYLMHSRQVEVE